MCRENRKIKMLKTFTLISFICVLKISSSYEAKDEGSFCQRLGLTGICTRVTNCSVALDALKRFKPHNLLRCGFVGSEEIVCCPGIQSKNPSLDEETTVDPAVVWRGDDKKPSPTRDDTSNGHAGRLKTKRKCEIMCEKIRKDNNIKPAIEFHVLNGEDAKFGQFPHMAALGYPGDDGTLDWKRCGGALISSRFVLTAAHCYVCLDCRTPEKVRFGVVDIRDDTRAQDVNIKEITPSENYNITSKHNDIALIELTEDVKMNENLYPACLYTEANDPVALLVTGWGITDPDNSTSRSDILQYGRLEPVKTEVCNNTILSKNRYTAKIILDNQICATSKSDACPGDSGAPLQIQKKQGGYDVVGIVSYGFTGKPCSSNIPGVYTRVSAYLDWIEGIVWPT